MIYRKLNPSEDGWEAVEILAFNYDGKGSALVLVNGMTEILQAGRVREIVGSGISNWRSYYLEGKEDPAALRKINDQIARRGPIDQNIRNVL